LGVNYYFWAWWLQPSHRGNGLIFTIISLAFFYDGTLLPTLLLYFLGRGRIPVKPEGPLPISKSAKIAMISLTVPGSESLEFVKKQLIAMKKVKYQHDTWILVDKCHAPEIQKLANKYRVNYFSRHDVAAWGPKQVEKWNQEVPPFKAKTKAGNVNSWLDAFGKNYQYFTQLDIDHLPKSDYLDQVLPYFQDPKVAWIQAPSVYGNLDLWTARGAAEQELILQGPLQMGFYGSTGTPFIIGSHCTYRMDAIRQIGGFQPTRAEDHLDTVYLAAHGYRGIFVPQIIAVGDGPENFETYLAQQFAWSYSLVQVLLFYSPKLLIKMPLRVAGQLIFAQTWYPLWSLSMFIQFIIPLVCLLLDQQIANVSFWQFTFRSFLIFATSLSVFLWSRKWHFPQNVSLSWRGFVLHLARWLVVLSAVIQAALKIKKPYMITPKGTTGRYELNPQAVQTYFIFGMVSLAVSLVYIFTANTASVRGYLLFSLENAFFMLIITLATVLMSVKPFSFEKLLKNKAPIILAGVLYLSFIITSYFSVSLISNTNFSFVNSRQSTGQAGAMDHGICQENSFSTIFSKIYCNQYIAKYRSAAKTESATKTK
jgi:cellulose synthase (UDP-forming)